MLTDQRRSQILQLTEESGFVSLHQLVEQTGASESTVRRDLEYLDSVGRLQRTRGGAVYCGLPEQDFEFRQSVASAEKQQIAQRCCDLISDRETVLLDGGTTTLEVARRLIGRNLRVVTNSVPIGHLLMSHPGIELFMIGGFVYPQTGVALGELALAALREINVTRLVMGAGGITTEGLFNSNALLVDTERQMLEVAEQITLVADSTKFGRRAFTHLCGLDRLNQVITDDGIPEHWREVLRKTGLDLEICTTE